MSSEKFGPIETKYIKGVAVVLMLYHHLYGFPQRLPASISGFFVFPEVCNFMANFGNICVSVFLLLAGYAAHLKLSGTTDPWNHVKKSMLSLYKVYWIISLIFIPLSILSGNAEFNLGEVLLNFAGLSFSYNNEAWFLFLYCLCGLLSPFIVNFINNKLSDKNVLKNTILIIVVLVLFTALISSFYAPVYNRLGDGIVSEMINFFSRIETYILGVMLAKLDLFNKMFKLEHFQQKRWFWIVISLFGIIGLHMVRMITCSNFIIYNIDPWLSVLVVVFCLTIQKYIPDIKRFFVAIGNESTIMWLTHTYICTKIAINWTYSFKFDLFVLWVLVAETYLISKVIKRLFNRVLVK